MNAPRHLTLRNVPVELTQSLHREAKRRGRTLNQTAVDLLRAGLGVGVPRSNGLRRFSGGWSEEDFERFEAAMAANERIDEEAWR
jgi:hypothetical protein